MLYFHDSTALTFRYPDSGFGELNLYIRGNSAPMQYRHLDFDDKDEALTSRCRSERYTPS